jgi:hypothetical protein
MLVPTMSLRGWETMLPRARLHGMRTAVLRILIDPGGSMSPDIYDSGVEALRSRGLQVVASPAAHLPHRDREIELIVDDFVDGDGPAHLSWCREVFGDQASLGVVTYVSRGTNADVQGVLEAFGVHGDVRRVASGDDEVVTVTLTPEALRNVAESRLHTALEAALNCEVRIEVEVPAASVTAS